MDSKMKELVKVTPMRARIVSLVYFTFWSFFCALMGPFIVFVSGACFFILYVHIVVNVPAVRCTEEPLYGDDPQGFFDLKVKYTFRLWAIGIIIMVTAFVAMEVLRLIMVYAGVVYSYEIPQIDLVSCFISLAMSLAPFIPATFALMGASYKFDDRTMS